MPEGAPTKGPAERKDSHLLEVPESVSNQQDLRIKRSGNLKVEGGGGGEGEGYKFSCEENERDATRGPIELERVRK